jgi:hypothetical protein
MDGRNDQGKFVKGFKHTSESRIKMSITRKKKGLRPPLPLGRKLSKETIEKISLKNLGRIVTEETRKKMSNARKGKCKGADNPFWKGGTSIFQMIIRGTWKYREWRDFIYNRDGYKCKFCSSCIEINAHHIKSFAKLLKENNIKTTEAAITCEKLWDLNNGITLCKKCHYKLHSKFI